MKYNINTHLKGEDILKIFIETGLHTVGNMIVRDYNQAVCVSLVTFVDGQKTLHICETQYNCHAEWGIIDFLGKNITSIRSVKIFCNYSPCSEPVYQCCNLIGRIKEDLKTQGRRRGEEERVSLTFVFSNLFIERPSCRKRNCFNLNGSKKHVMPLSDSTTLRNLCLLGPSIRSFEMADWVALIELLALLDAYRRVEAGMLTSIRFGEKYCFLRDLEDAEMKRDFQILTGRYNGL